MSFDVILCQDIKGGIGKDGKLPWNNPEEMAFFKKVTSWTENPDSQNAVIMGRKTWESIPEKYRPLPGRYNIILSNSSVVRANYNNVFTSLDKGLIHAAGFTDIERIYVIGGKQVYDEALKHPDLNLIHLSVLYKDYDCDTFVELPENLEEIARAQNVSFVNYILKKAQ